VDLLFNDNESDLALRHNSIGIDLKFRPSSLVWNCRDTKGRKPVESHPKSMSLVQPYISVTGGSSWKSNTHQLQLPKSHGIRQPQRHPCPSSKFSRNTPFRERP